MREKSKLTSLSRYCNYDEEQKQLTMEQEYRSITPQSQYVLKLFDQTATIHMTSVPEYNSLKEIGTPVTHNGRTWVFQGTWEDDETLEVACVGNFRRYLADGTTDERTGDTGRREKGWIYSMETVRY